jgi:DNA-binding MarR family transcriptional regulator
MLFLCPLGKCESEGNVDRKPTQKQGQYLAFIYYYTKLNGRPPAEAEIQWHFRVTPPTVHQMILSLEKHGFIGRVPGQARSIRILLSREDFPDLE